MTSDVDAAAAEKPWTRLHPLSPLLQFGRVFAVVGALFLPRLANPTFRQDRHVPWPELLVGAALVLTGFISWLVTRWRVSRGELQIETGLIRRQSIRVPLRRVQAIDVVTPLLGRVLGLAELRIVLAGSGTSSSRLAYLGEQRAHEVRAELLALGAGLAGDTPVPPERRLIAVDFSTLLASVTCSVTAAVATTVVLGVGIAAVLAESAVLVLAVCWPVLITAGASMLRRLNAEYGFTVAEAPDGLRLRSGLLSTRAETVPTGRVQAVRWISPVLWRFFGWHRLEIDVARQRSGGGENESGQLTSALLPVGSEDAATRLLARVLPGAHVTPPAGSQPPRRARWRAPLSYRNLRAWYDGTYVWTRTGRLRPTVTIVPLEKVQSLRWVQGPLQRRLRLATLHVDTAGRGWHAVAHARDQDEATHLLHRLTELSRLARRPASTWSSASLHSAAPGGVPAPTEGAMREPEVFLLAEQALQKVVDAIAEDQWDQVMPSDFPMHADKPMTLREVINYHAYDDAWVPDMLAGRTMAEVGADAFSGDLLGEDPKANFAAIVARACAAARAFEDLDRTVHCSFGDFPAREYLWQANSFRGLRAHDLAKVIGADPVLPAELVQGLWEEIEPHAEEWRALGVFGPRVQVPPTASLQDRLLGLTGRTPD